MVSAPQTDLKPNLTLDVAVLSKAYVGEVSLSQLARDLGADVSNVRKAKNWLINNRHPTFEGYEADTPLNPEQAEAIVTFRSYTTIGIKGDLLTEKMFPDPSAENEKKTALRDLFEQVGLPPEQAAKLTHSILEIFR